MEILETKLVTLRLLDKENNTLNKSLEPNASYFKIIKTTNFFSSNTFDSFFEGGVGGLLILS